MAFQHRKSFKKIYTHRFIIEEDSAPISFQQHQGKCGHCTAIDLMNPSQYFWMSVNCTVPLLHHVLCVVPNQTLGEQLLREITPEPLYCCDPCILKDCMCFMFYWITTGEARNQSCFRNPSVLAHIYNAVGGHSFPPVFTSNITLISIQRYYHNITEVRKQDISVSDEGFYIVKEKFRKFSILYTTLECKMGSYISVQYLCDGVPDCPVGSDEINCECSATDSFVHHCKFITKPPKPHKRRTCSPLYFTTHDGNCVIHNFESKQLSEMNKDTTHSFENNGDIFGDNAKYELMTDCLKGEFQYGTHFETMQMNKTSNSCEHSYQIPCREGHSKCYNISEVCGYKLNSVRRLEPCRTGEHLQACKAFECNLMFKCHQFYCIPWSYVCDGKWDCPSGYDEYANSTLCQTRNCTQMFSCKSSKTCIHLANVCDGQPHCVLEDDESICSLSKTYCFLKCVCLTFAITCNNVSLPEQSKQPMASFKAIFLQNVHLNFVLDVFLVVTLHTKDCNLTDICNFVQKSSSLLLLNVEDNKISHLESECLKTAQNLTVLNLQSNCIVRIPSNAFCSLLQLMFLNLSNNPITEIMVHPFVDLKRFRGLSLLNISHVEGYDHILQDLDKLQVLQTTNPYFCCFETTYKCSTQVPWHFSCSDLLPNTGMKASFYSFSSVILILNTLSLTLQLVLHRLDIEKSATFSIIIGSVNSADVLYSLPLFLLWTFDLAYKGKFISRQMQWRSSLTCFTIFPLFCQFNVVSPVLIFLMSISRLMVVNHPLDTQFKSSTFVVKSVSVINMVAVSTACVSTTLMWLVDVEILRTDLPMVICSPFADPSNKMIMIKVLTAVVVCLQIISILSIFVVYVKLLISLKESQRKIESSRSKKQSNTPLIVQLVVIMCANILCWVPSCAVYVTAMFLGQYPVAMIIWTTVAVASLNSVTNPTVFVVTAARKFAKHFCPSNEQKGTNRNDLQNLKGDTTLE